MNWITKIIKAGEKIKSALHKRATKEDIANSDWTSCCKGPILKKDLKKNLWVCPEPECNKHHNLYLERNHVSQIERQEINYYLRYNLIEPEI